MNMHITEVKIYPTNEDLVKADVTIVFDHCLMIEEIKIIKGTTGLFVWMPNKKQIDGTYWDIAYAINTETRNMIEQAVLTEYEKVIAEATQCQSPRQIINTKNN
jgi:stage V sporulation protein G